MGEVTFIPRKELLRICQTSFFFLQAFLFLKTMFLQKIQSRRLLLEHKENTFLLCQSGCPRSLSILSTPSVSLGLSLRVFLLSPSPRLWLTPEMSPASLLSLCHLAPASDCACVLQSLVAAGDGQLVWVWQSTCLGDREPFPWGEAHSVPLNE